MAGTAAVGNAPLLEREAELARIDGLLADAREGAGGVLILEGPAGAGKTRLLQAALDAAGSGFTVAVAHAGELERSFAYGVVRQLLEPLVAALPPAERRGAFAGPASLAASVIDDVTIGEADPGPVRHGLYHLALTLARGRPLLIAVDDLQWADAPSLEWLVHLARRIAAVPIVVVATHRTDGDDDGSDLVGHLAATPRASSVEPAALSPGAVEQLARAALGEAVGSQHGADCHRLTGGNPFLVQELLHEAQRAPGAALDLETLVPDGVARTVLRRLSRLPAGTAEVAGALAVLERASYADDVAALAGLEPGDDLAGILDALAAAGIVAADPPPFRFAHPLTRQVVYATLPPGKRSLQHERAARLLADRGASEESASHVLRSNAVPPPWAVGVLREAARVAMRRATPALAARCLIRALPAVKDPPDRTELLAELGRAELRSLDPAGFDHLREAIASAGPRTEAAELAITTARGLTALWRHGEAVELLTPLLSGSEPLEDALDRALEAELVATATADVTTLPVAAAALTRALERRRSSPSTHPVPWGVQTMLRAAGGRDRATTADVAREVGELRVTDGASGDGLAVQRASTGLPYPSMALVWCGDVDTAEAAWRAALVSALAAGSLLDSALARGYLAVCSLARGHARDAEAHARAALDSLDETAVPAGPYPLAPLADALVERGAAQVAITLLADHDGAISRTSVSFPLVLLSRGRARIAAGDRDGVEDVLEAGRRMTASGAGNPAVAPWRSLAGVAIAAVDPSAATELVDEEVELAREFGAPDPLATALTAAAAIASTAARGPDLAAEAVAVAERSSAGGALAAALACQGRVLAASGQTVEARTPLRRALDIAHRAGATALAERARADLVAAGGRPRRAVLSGRDALTPRELSVAELAAAGRSSRDIADELVVSIRTVDMHLTRVYRKLGIDGRTDLPGALGR